MSSFVAKRALGARTLALVAALTLVSSAAWAKHHHKHADGGAEGADDKDDMPAGHVNGGEMPTAADGGGLAEDDEAADDDGGAPIAVTRTPAQTERRDALLAKEHGLVRGLAIRGGKKVPLRVRQAVGLHWRHVMRLLRIREIAEDLHDTATVARVDALLDLADKSFTKRMDALTGSVSDGGAP